MTPSIQHWLVGVAVSAGLPEAAELRLEPGTPTAEAWKRVAAAAGIDPAALTARVAGHYRLDVASVEDREATASRLVPAAAARRLGVVPLRYTDRTVVVATSDPVGMEAERELGQLTSRNVVFEVAPPDAIADALDVLYPPSGTPQHELPKLPTGTEGGPHVLVVDDDPGMRELLGSTLRDRGFRVSEAPDGTDALDMLEHHHVHLVTLDLQMDGMGGMEVLRRMRSKVKLANIPVIVATGTDDPAVEVEALAAGADDYVVKPIDPPRFLLRLQAVLRRYGAGATTPSRSTETPP